MTIFWILLSLLVLCVLIVVHEFGHFLAGRLLGFTIEEFAVGFGPAILSRKGKSGTLFSWRWIPLGGYCRFAGEDQEEAQPGDFNAQPPWKRFVVQISGVLFNIVLAFLLALLLFGWLGSYRPMIYEVEGNSPAAEAGVLPGDELLTINGKKVNSQNVVRVISKVYADQNAVLEMTLERNGEVQTVDVGSVYDEELGRSRMGVTITSGSPLRLGLGEAMETAVYATGESATEVLKALGNLVINPQTASQGLSGPIGTVAIMGEGLEESFSQDSEGEGQAVNWRGGFSMLLSLGILISVNLGVFNLLPLPALDGGRLVFTLIEMITKRTVPRNVEGVVHLVGLALLFGLAILLAFQDISRLAGG